MKNAILATLLLTISATLGQAATKDEQMIEAAKALDARFIEVYNKGDAAAAATCYWNSPDVVSFPPDVLALRGYDELAKTFDEALEQPSGGKLEITEAHYQVAGDVVISWGLWKFTMTAPDGKTTESVGRYTDVKAERDGKWVYIIDHASAPMTPPAK